MVIEAQNLSKIILAEVVVVVVVIVVSHIQCIGCQPEITTLYGGQSRSWPAEQGKENITRKSAPPPPPYLMFLVRRI